VSAPQFSDRDLDELARTHLSYEVRMLVEQACKFHARYRDGMARLERFKEPVLDDALLEATLVHLRLLDDFLGPRRKDDRDLHASDWIADWAASQWLPSGEWKRVGAQVVHLSWRRDPRFEWDIRAYVYACCEELDRFFREVKLRDAVRHAALADAHKHVRDGLRSLAPPAPSA